MSEMSPIAEPTVPVQPLRRSYRRVLGVLIEKAFCTPDQYPLTANAVVVACNQKTNRDPVTDYAPDIVDESLIDLQKMGLVIRVLPATGRTDRWKHNIKDAWVLDRPQRAVLGELLLRGPQTEGDLRGRASRMVNIATLEELNQLLESLALKGFVRLLSPAEQKRGRVWTHLLVSPEELAGYEAKYASGTPSDEDEEPSASAPRRAASAPHDPGMSERVTMLEGKLAQLGDQVTMLTEELARVREDCAAQVRDLRQELGG